MQLGQKGGEKVNTTGPNLQFDAVCNMYMLFQNLLINTNVFTMALSQIKQVFSLVGWCRTKLSLSALNSITCSDFHPDCVFF